MLSIIRIGFPSVFFFLFLLMTTSCTKEETPYQLSDEQLVDIVTDIHISESATQHLSLAFRDSMVVVYLDQILEIHEVPKEVFEPDYQKLKRDPKKLQFIYAKVIEKLNILKRKKEKKKEKKGKKRASEKKDKKKVKSSIKKTLPQ